jgi:phosphatidyl-myo-inositol dimannoside synthase
MSGPSNGRARRTSQEPSNLSPCLLLVYDFPPMGGGIARWMGELARRHRPGSLVVSTGSYPRSELSDRLLPNPVDRLPIPSSRLRTVQGTWRWSRRVETLTRTLSADFIWCGNIKPATYPARWTRMRAGVAYGIFLHGGDLLILRRQARRSLIKRRTARSLLGCASVLVANSSWTAELCRTTLEELDIAALNRVRTVPLGTDPAVFRSGIDQADVRRRYGLDQRRWLLSVARLTRHKGIDTALHVLAQLAPEYPDLAYAIVGSGDYLPALEHLSRTLGIANRVRFLTQVPDADLPALYNCAEVYLGLSRLMDERVEGFGISLAEASACGIPVVAGRSGGIPEAVRQDQTGFLVNPEQPTEIAATLRRLLDDRELALRLGAAGRRAVESYYNWDRVADDVQGIAEEYGRVKPPSLPDAR